jgi:hypothetical protein
VEPRDIAGRKLQVQDPHRTVLEDLTVMRLLMDGHHRFLSLTSRVGRLPRGDLATDRGGAENDGCKDE